MFKNYFLITIRNLLRQKLYTTLNIIGLTIGLAAFIAVALYVYDEQSFDRFHSKSERIYRLIDQIDSRKVAITPYKWSEHLKDFIPEIEETVAIQKISAPVRRGDEIDVFNETNIFAADSTFFKVFDFPIIRGNKKKFLLDINDVIITKEMAEKYFENEDPIGKVLSINLFGTFVDYVVKGIVDVPANSHLQFEFLIPFEHVINNHPNLPAYESWRVHFAYTYLLLKDKANPGQIESKFNDFLLTYADEETANDYKPEVEPLTDIYLKSNLAFDLKPRGSITNVWILSTVGLVILIIAIINFVNLATATSLRRAKEVSVRKVYGARKVKLIGQFLFESTAMIAVAMILAVGLVVMFLPFLNSITEKSLDLFKVINGSTILFLLSIVFIGGFAAGSYPAFVISSFSPVQVLRGKKLTNSYSTIPRKFLVILQFTIAVVLIIGAVAIHQQLDFLLNKDLGFDKSQLVIVNDAGLLSQSKQDRELMEDLLSRRNDVVSVSYGSSYPTALSHWSVRYTSNGLNDGKDYSLTTIFADYDFAETFDLEIIKGRNFEKERGTDLNQAFILNEAAVDFFGGLNPSWLENPVGKDLARSFGGKSGTVVGVIKNFNYESLHNQIRPLVLQILPDNFFYTFLKIKSQNIEDTISGIEKTWSSVAPNVPFDYEFLNQEIDNAYKTDKKIQSAITIFAQLAIFIALFGLFGIASFVIHSKVREISIRKVLGANLPQLIYQLSRQFLMLILLANIISWPIAYYILNKWLSNFAYRIDIPFEVFILALIGSILLSTVVISYHSYITASRNPVDVLSQE